MTGPETRQSETQEKERAAFLAALETGVSIAKAARIAGVGRATVYRWRNEDEDFAKAWDDAYDTGTDALEDEAKRRGVEGVERRKFYKGQSIYVEGPAGEPVPYLEREYSDTLLAMQLNARRPEKYRANHNHVHTGAVKLSFDRDDGEL